MRRMVRGTETVLGDAAAPDELFLSDAFESRCHRTLVLPITRHTLHDRTAQRACCPSLPAELISLHLGTARLRSWRS